MRPVMKERSEMRPERTDDRAARAPDNSRIRIRPDRRRGRQPRRLGPLEYTLVALIALGIAVTIVMALVNP